MEYQDFERCAKCKGRCCFLYLSGFIKDYKIAFPKKEIDLDKFIETTEYFEDEYPNDFKLTYYTKSVNLWKVTFERCGAVNMPAMYDPIEINQVGRQMDRLSLIKQGMHPIKCQYCGSKGCVLPWKSKPDVCRNYRCD